MRNRDVRIRQQLFCFTFLNVHKIEEIKNVSGPIILLGNKKYESCDVGIYLLSCIDERN